MKVHFSVCHKCKTFDYKYLIDVLRKNYPDATFDVKCQSYCGPGSVRPFVSINENFIDAENIDELIYKIDEFIRGNLCLVCISRVHSLLAVLQCWLH